MNNVTHQSKRRLFKTSFLIFLLIFIIAAINYLWQWQKNQQTNNLQQIHNLLTDQQSQLVQLHQSLTELQSSLQQQQQSLSKTQAGLQTILQNTKVNNVDWTLAQVQYLLRIANLNLTYAKDAKTALAIEQTADNDLRNLNDPRFDAIRKLMAADMLKLQEATNVDLSGILARLTAVQQQLAALPLQNPKVNLIANTKIANNSPAQSDWRQNLRASLQSLQQLVIIRHNDQAIVPLLSPDEHFYLELNLQILLEKAQLAALRGQDDIFQNCLQSASSWIKRYYVSNAPATQGILTALVQLQQTPINPSLPDITPTSDALQQLIDQRHAINGNDSSSSNTEAVKE